VPKSPRLPLFAFLAAAAAFLVLLVGARVPGSHLPTTSTKVLTLLGFLVLVVPGVWFIVATLRDLSPPDPPR
jgi:hypothetical protein